MGMECATKAREIYIFRMSCSFNGTLKTEFTAAACVEILNTRAFILNKRALAAARCARERLSSSVAMLCHGPTLFNSGA